MPIGVLQTVAAVCLLITCTFANAVNTQKITKQKWLELKSENFTLITDQKEKKARAVIQDLENFRHFLINLVGMDVIENPPPLLVFAIGNGKTFKNLNIPDNWAGFFHMSRHGYFAVANITKYSTNPKRTSSGRNVLLHEYYHYMLRLTNRSIIYPNWYEEGMAEYWSTFKYTKDTITIGDPKTVGNRVYDLMGISGSHITLNSEKTINTTELKMKSDNRKDRRAASRFYAESFFIVHYLNADRGRQAQLHSYLNKINSGTASKDAFDSTFSFDYEELNSDVKKYILSGRVTVRNYDLKKIGFSFLGTPIETRTLPKNDIIAYTAKMFWNFSYKEIPYEARVELLKEAIEQNPNDTALKLRQYLLTKGKCDCLTPKQLLKKFPKSTDAWVLVGWEKYRQAEGYRKAGLPQWEKTIRDARKHFRIAIKLDKNNSYAFFGLAYTYDYLDKPEPLSEGIISYDAASLFERDPVYFREKARIELRNNQPTYAITSLRAYKAFAENDEPTYPNFLLDALELIIDTSLVKVTDHKPEFQEGITYVGEIKDGLPHGRGKLTRANGSVYEGAFQKGKITGKGTFTSITGYQYSGDFQDAIFEGQGTLTYPKTEKGVRSFSGTFKNMTPNGYGFMKNISGSVYEGEYKHFSRHGKGKATLKSGVILEGEWVWGRLKWPEDNGIIFVGGYNTETGEKKGKGVCYATDEEKPYPCKAHAGKIFTLKEAS